jgi:thiol-disulfide isomerase/thioredoxin
MSKAGSLTKNPTVLTVVLSLAALAGYATYRLSTNAADAPPATPLASAEDEHAHDEEHPPLPDTLPAIVLDDLAGTPTSLASLAGQPLLINFWATWCAPCLREIPLLKRFHEEDPSIRVVGIAVDRLADVLEYSAEMEFNYPVLVGQEEAMAAAETSGIEFVGLPFTMVISPDGQLIKTHMGEILETQLEAITAVLERLEGGEIDVEAARAALGRL